MWSKWQWVRRIAVDADADLLDRGEDALGLLAGVDDQAAVGAVAAEQEAVLGDRADREHLDIEAHFLAGARIRARSRRRHIVVSM